MKKNLVGLLVLWAAGSAGAAQADLAPRNAALDAQVAFWTSGVSAADLAADAPCAAPNVPEVSTRNLEIRAVSQSIERWESCHKHFMQQLASTPAEARLPAEVLAAMSADQRQQAVRHVEAVQATVRAQAFADGAAQMARNDAWLARTLSRAAAEYPALAASRLQFTSDEASTLFDAHKLRYEQQRQPRRARGF